MDHMSFMGNNMEANKGGNLLTPSKIIIIFLMKVILRFFESNETRSKTTDEGGDSLNDGTVQHRHSQVSRAHLHIHILKIGSLNV